VRFLKHFLARRAEITLLNLRRMKRTQACLAGHAYLYIDPTGSVRDCPVAAREMGDLRENQLSLERILKSETARRVREQVNKSECFCTMSAPALSNIFLSPSEYIKLAGASL
jgi:MoaA/NifB/PqqE/SkfB family radical SAM enzyme